INVSKGTEYYTRDKIESMILNCNDEVLQEIIDIKDVKIIDLFNSILVGLENSNAYDISSRVALYIRARKEELDNKSPKTELEVTPSKVIETAVIEEVEKIEEEIVATIEKTKSPKKPATTKTTTSKTKKTTKK
ncbi:MAG: hypothetical protein ACRCTZ_06145, partial [Sarcina sp.]